MEEEEIGMNFNEWLNHDAREFNEIWEGFHTEDGQHHVIGLSSSFIQLLNEVITYLNDIHERNNFNGNLLENLRIRRKNVGLIPPIWKVEFVINPPLILPIKGIALDVQHFRDMVHSACIQRYPLVKYPVACLLFLGPYYDIEKVRHNSLHDVKKIAFFNYSHPLFFNKVGRAHFIYKLYEIRKRNPSKFERLVRLDNTFPLADMTGWSSRIPIDPNLSECHDNQGPLRQVMYFRQSQRPYKFRDYFNSPSEVINYLRTVCEHGRDVHRHLWSGKILKDLHRVLPDSLSKIHLLLCYKFADPICRWDFGADNIMKLMRHGPFGYKGLKF